ncbi:FAD-dependent monooxygenase [Pseudohalioglobus sediminis]|uniref:FAD-dependent monooxygenase n=1 Tax=Pseudohalioglobus sediminis TaxID=2606449 RepID=A0A5B0X518_9GAMM|nr:FAD-dependent monooxygenase [Pseudohalioglobus sediminis]KAA1193401.1 FAD-dependent monooxygenase [Pseudohalioglobus sediminis]
MATAPVIIAGAGPVGCHLALYLACHDVPVVLLEKEPELPVDLRASTFHPPSLEMIADLGCGIIEQMLAKGLVVGRYQYRDRSSGDVANFDMSLLSDDTRFPFRLQLEQYEYTRMAVAALQQMPCADIRFATELVSFTQTDEHVEVTVEHHGDSMQLRGSFLVSAEGARSRVRKSAGIDYLGFTYDEKFLVVSTPFPFEEVFDDLAWVNYIADPEEWCVILRTEKIWRVLFPTRPESADDEAYLLSDDFVQARLHHLWNKSGDYEIGHRTLYNVNQRVAETYYRGRVLLAGDACHINNPLGGMGMNGGIHDADNLGEKLVRVLRDGAAHQPLFDLYNRQRRDLAVRFVQDHTIANKKLMEATDAATQTARQQMLMQAAGDPVRARQFLMERAMINCVRDSLAVA